MNALKPLDFPNNYFDLIHMRTAIGFIPRERWLEVFLECKRKLRPGGILLSTEGENGVFTNASTNTAHLMHWLTQVIDFSGLAFWDKWGSMLGIHGMQRHFIRKARFENIQEQLFYVDASFDTKQYLSWLGHHATMVKDLKPTICKSPELGGLGVSESEFEAVLDASYEEVRHPDFISYSYYQAVAGQKPLEDN
jgi:SAM-dependent methyltransferase